MALFVITAKFSPTPSPTGKARSFVCLRRSLKREDDGAFKEIICCYLLFVAVVHGIASECLFTLSQYYDFGSGMFNKID